MIRKMNCYYVKFKQFYVSYFTKLFYFIIFKHYEQKLQFIQFESDLVGLPNISFKT